MPRVSLAGDKYQNKDLAELIRRYKYSKGLTNTTAGKLVGVCDRTFARYLEQPGTIPIGVLRIIQKKFQIPKEEMIKYIL